MSLAARKTIYLDYDTDKHTGGAIVFDEHLQEIERFAFYGISRVDKAITFLEAYGEPIVSATSGYEMRETRIARIFPMQSIKEVTTRNPTTNHEPKNG